MPITANTSRICRVGMRGAEVTARNVIGAAVEVRERSPGEILAHRMQPQGENLRLLAA
jgi:hypothetical protein